MDRATARELRRVNVIVYANYGEQNAQIVHGRDHDYPDIRSHAHNTFIKSRIADLAAEARRVIEEAEQKQVMRIKCLIREYYLTKSEAVKKEFEEANTIFPFLFSRAFLELRMERATLPHAVAAGASPTALPDLLPVEEARSAADIVKELAAQIQQIMVDIDDGLQRLKAAGKSDDILVQTCRKLIARAQETAERPRGLGLHRETPGDDAQQPEHDLAPGGEPPEGQPLEPAGRLSPWPPALPRSCSGPRARAS